MEVSLIGIFSLFVAYQAKHFLCDYPLQTSYMLGKFRDEGWVKPLAAHSAVHAVGTFIVLVGYMLYYNHPVSVWEILGLAMFDFIAHFGMDRVKASPRLLGRFSMVSKAEYIELIKFEAKHGENPETRRIKMDNHKYWLALGIDQMAHNLTHYVIIYYVMC